MKAHPNLCEYVNQTVEVLGNDTCDKLTSWPRPKLRTLMAAELLEGLENEVYVYARKNVMVLKVYLQDLTVTQYLKDEKITTISFIANTGGLLGLCMGLSVITIFEIGYHSFKALSQTDFYKRCKSYLPSWMHRSLTLTLESKQ
jgi:hypothetical protein